MWALPFAASAVTPTARSPPRLPRHSSGRTLPAGAESPASREHAPSHAHLPPGTLHSTLAVAQQLSITEPYSCSECHSVRLYAQPEGNEVAAELHLLTVGSLSVFLACLIMHTAVQLNSVHVRARFECASIHACTTQRGQAAGAMHAHLRAWLHLAEATRCPSG